MNSWFKYIVVFVALFLPCSVNAKAGGVGLSLDEWIEEFRREAVEKGVSAQSLDMAFKDLSLQPKVISLDRKQPEHRRDFQSYIDNAINNLRIKKAKAFLKKYATLLKEIEQKYGVPANYIIAFWGMETNFGATKGTHSTINALATLAYDTRRPLFFKAELLNAVLLVQDGIPVDKIIGSWAGAVGNFQFMPSTYRAFGVDYDNDGQVNLWDSMPDAFASAANYLSKEGWDNSVEWGREVVLPKKFNWNLIEQKRTLKEWNQEGVRFVNPTEIKESDDVFAELFLPAGLHGPAFLMYSNFRVILKWNNSILYAIAVGHLADRIKGKKPFLIKTNQKGAGFSMENAEEVQELLSTMKLYNGKIDGLLGKKSREAIRDFQSMYELPADGYANSALLDFMRLVLKGGEKRKKLTFDESVEIQRILSKGKYYIGPIDGKIGPATKKGIERYKKAYGIDSDVINRSLLEKMRVQSARNLEN